MSGLKGEVDVPGLGGVDKRVLLGVGGVAAAYVGWRWYQARSGAGYDPEAEAVDPGMEDPGVLPPVAGAVRPDNGYGLPDGDAGGGTTDSYGFRGTTNSQWVQYATGKLSGSDEWSYTAITTALGKYILGKPLAATEQAIVQAAIGQAGYPPESPNAPIIPGADVPVTVAPTGLKVTATGTDYVNLSWVPVAGARDYRVFRSGAATSAQVATGGSTTVYGLQPNTAYSFQVAAVAMGGSVGPKSSSVNTRTKAVALKAPAGVRVSSVTATAVTVSWGKVAGATAYRIYLNGTLRGAADGGVSTYRVTGLSKRTRYSVVVRADTTNQTPGPPSRAVSVTTKSK